MTLGTLELELELDLRQGNTGSLSEDTFRRLSNIMKDHFFPKKSYLFWEGDTSDKLFFVKSGSVKITKSTSEGKEFTLYVYQTGDLICYGSPLVQTKHSYTAEIMESATIGIMDQHDVQELIYQHPTIAHDFIKWMGTQHLITQSKLRDLLFFGKFAALCSTILRLCNSYGEKVGDHIVIRQKLTHLELSNMISATRESVNRMIIELRALDVLEYKDGIMKVKDLSYFEESCHCETCSSEICRM